MEKANGIIFGENRDFIATMKQILEGTEKFTLTVLDSDGLFNIKAEINRLGEAIRQIPNTQESIFVYEDHGATKLKEDEKVIRAISGELKQRHLIYVTMETTTPSFIQELQHSGVRISVLQGPFDIDEFIGLATGEYVPLAGDELSEVISDLPVRRNSSKS